VLEARVFDTTVGQNSPSATFPRLPDQPDRAAHGTLQNELFWSHQADHNYPEVL